MNQDFLSSLFQEDLTDVTGRITFPEASYGVQTEPIWLYCSWQSNLVIAVTHTLLYEKQILIDSILSEHIRSLWISHNFRISILVNQPYSITWDLSLLQQYFLCNLTCQMNPGSLISLFGMSHGPFEAPKSQLEVKRTSLEFNFRKFCQNIKKVL